MKRILGWSAASLGGGILVLLSAPEAAEAHVCMDFPVSRVGPECVARSPQKVGPCPVPRSEYINVFRPGETIRVRLRETIDHPSHYRIAFDPQGEDFRDPVSVDDKDNDYPHILVDGIIDEEDAIQEVEITFPSTPTENGTLQLIQVMYDKGGNGFGGANGGPDDNDDMYYSCADIVLRGEPVAHTPDAAPVNERRGAAPILGTFAAIGLMGIAAGAARKKRS